jgi:hypothetical protein
MELLVFLKLSALEKDCFFVNLPDGSLSDIARFMKFRNINLFKHFIINDQYQLDIVDRLDNCKTIKCNYVHYFMIIRIIYSLI